MSEIPGVLQRGLSEFAGCRRRWRLIRGAAEGLLVWFLGLLFVALVDLVFGSSGGWQVLLGLSTYACAALVFSVRGLLPALARRRPVQVALAIEEAVGGRLEERLSSAVELAGSGGEGVSRWMINRTVSLAVGEISGLDPRGIVDTGPARRASRRLAVAGLLIGMLLALPVARVYVLRAMLPGANLARPSSTALKVEPGDVLLAAGRTLVVSVGAAPGPEGASLLVEWEDGLVEELAMKPQDGDGEFELSLPDLMQGLHYRVRAGDAESRLYSVTVQQPPGLKSIELTVTPPAYAGGAARTVSGGDAAVLAGSTVVMRAELAGPPASAVELVPEGGPGRAMELSGRTVGLQMKVMKTLRYRLRMVGADGLVALSPQQWDIEVVPDAPPQAELRGLGLDGGLAGLDEQLVLRIAVTDDWGLGEAALIMRVDDGPGRRVRALAPTPGAEREIDEMAALDLRELGLRKGQSLTLFVKATDLGGGVSRSEPVVLAVVDGEPAGTAAVAAELWKLHGRLRGLEAALGKEVRVWEDLARSYRREDPEAQRGTLVVARQRLTAAFESAGGCGGAVGREASKLTAGLGERIYGLGASLREWASGRGGVCLAKAAEEGGGSRALRTVEELVSTARAELARFRQHLGLAAARVEAEGMVLQSEAAHSRQERTAPVLEGYWGWKRLEMHRRPGLLGRFYAGTQLEGAEVHRTAGAPSLSNFKVPGAGATNWSVRFTGEVRVPEDGEWTFTCRADDGVRLRVAGRELIGSKAWVSQAPTYHSGKLEVKAGWHPVEIRMFQGTAGSHLSFYRALGRGGRQLVPATDLRHLPADAEGRRDLVRKMSSLPAQVVANADSRLRHDCEVLGQVPGTIARMARGVEVRGLADLARAAGGPAGTVSAALETAAASNWGEVPFADLSAGCSALNRRAREARDLMARSFDHALAGDRYPAGVTRDLERAMGRIRKRAIDLPTLGKGKLESDRRELVERSIGAMHEELKHLEGQVGRARRGLWKRAARLGSSLGERQQAFKTRERMDEAAGDSLARAAKAAAGALGEPEKAAELVAAVRRQLDGALTAVRSAAYCEKYADGARSADRAGKALRAAAEAWSPPADPLEREKARKAMADHVAVLAEEKRRAGHFEAAGELDEKLKEFRECGSREPLKRQLSALARRNYEEEWRVGEGLTKEAERIEQKKDSASRTAERMKGMALRVELTAEFQEGRGRAGEANAYRRVRDSLNELARREKRPTGPEVRKLAEQVAAIENRKGEAAKKDTLARAEEYEKSRAGGDGRVAAARKLRGLAEEVIRAVSSQAERDRVREKLRELDAAAEDSLLRAKERSDAAAALQALAEDARGSAKALGKLTGEARAAGAEEARARADFAAAEGRIAQALRKLEGRAGSEAGRQEGRALKDALKRLAEKLPGQAGRIGKLGEAAAAPGPEGAAEPPAEADSEALRKRAREATKLAEGAAKAARRAGEAVGRAEEEHAREGSARAAEDAAGLAARRKRGAVTSGKLAELGRAIEKDPGRDGAAALEKMAAAGRRAESAAKDVRRAAESGRELARIERRARALKGALREAGREMRRQGGNPDAPAVRERVAEARGEAGRLEAAARALDGKAREELKAVSGEALEFVRAGPGRNEEEREARARTAAELGRRSAGAKRDKSLAARALEVAARARRALERAGRKPEKPGEGQEPERTLPAEAYAGAAAAEAAQLAGEAERAAAGRERRQKEGLKERAGALAEVAAAAQALGAGRKGKRHQEVARAAKELAGKAAGDAAATEAEQARAEGRSRKALAGKQRLAVAGRLAEGARDEGEQAGAAAEDARELAGKVAGNPPQGADREARGQDIRAGLERADEAGRRAARAAELAGRVADALGRKRPEQQTEAEAAARAAAAMKEWQAAQQAAARAAADTKEAERAARQAADRAEAGKRNLQAAVARRQGAEVAAARARKGAEQEKAQAAAAAARQEQARSQLAAAERSAAAAARQRVARAAAERARAAAETAAGKAGEAAAAAKKLAAASGGEAGPAGPAARKHMTSRQLAEAARGEARAIREDLSGPLAEAFKAQKPPGAAARKAAEEVGRLGEELAGLAARQAEAAERLAASRERQRELQAQLARELEQASRLAGRGSEVLANAETENHTPLGAAREQRAAELQAQADAAQRGADAAQQSAAQAAKRVRQLGDRGQAAAGNAQQVAAIEAQLQKAREDTRARQAKAVGTQDAALEKQVQALEAQQAQMGALAAGSPGAAVAGGKAMANLKRAEVNSRQALDNARGQGAPAAASARGAEQNLERAVAAQQQLAAMQTPAARALQGELSALAEGARAAGQAARAGSQMAAAEARGQPGGQDAQRTGGGQTGDAAQQVQSSPAAAASQAIRRALETVTDGPQSGSTYQSAAKGLSQAASALQAAASPLQSSGAAGGQGPSRPGQSEAQRMASASSDGRGRGSAGRRDPGDLRGFQSAEAGEDAAGWARLRDRMRKRIRSGGVEDFSEEHQDAIRAYFRRLGEIER